MKKKYYDAPRLLQTSACSDSICSTSPGWEGNIDNLTTDYDENIEIE